MGSIFGHRIGYNGVRGFWEASGTYPAKINPSTHPPPPPGEIAIWLTNLGPTVHNASFWQKGLLNVVLSEYPDKSHNFTNLIFLWRHSWNLNHSISWSSWREMGIISGAVHMRQVGLQGVDLFETYVCSHRICLLEFFILQPQNRKKKQWKNGHRQSKIYFKKDEHTLTKEKKKRKKKKKQAKVMAARVWHAWIHPRPYPGWMTSSSSEELEVLLFWI